MFPGDDKWFCALCFEFESECAPDWFVATTTGHIYHFQNCIKKWLDTGNSRCPMTNEIIGTESLTRLYGLDPSCRRVSTDSGTLTVDELHISSSEPDYSFKMVLLGDPQVGKSSLMTRYSTGVFNYAVTATVGYDLSIKTVAVGGKILKLCLWDTGGQERFKSIAQNLVRNVHGVILVYSYASTEASSLKSIEGWVQFVKQYGIPGAAMLLVGNKSDIPQAQRVITTEQGQEVARKLGLQFFETSARDELNVDAAFRALAVETLFRAESNHLEYRTLEQDRQSRVQLQDETTPPVVTQTTKSSSCC